MKLIFKNNKIYYESTVNNKKEERYISPSGYLLGDNSFTSLLKELYDDAFLQQLMPNSNPFLKAITTANPSFQGTYIPVPIGGNHAVKSKTFKRKGCAPKPRKPR